MRRSSPRNANICKFIFETATMTAPVTRTHLPSTGSSSSCCGLRVSFFFNINHDKLSYPPRTQSSSRAGFKASIALGQWKTRSGAATDLGEGARRTFFGTRMGRTVGASLGLVNIIAVICFLTASEARTLMTRYGVWVGRQPGQRTLYERQHCKWTLDENEHVRLTVGEAG